MPSSTSFVPAASGGICPAICPQEHRVGFLQSASARDGTLDRVHDLLRKKVRTAEGTYAWLGRWRPLSEDREKCVLSSESFINLAMIPLMLHRLASSDVDPEFRDPRPVAA